jgi:Holliday junction resolvase RusA-like endonuclease
MNFTAYLIPVAKARARLTVIAGHAHAYTPKKTANAEQIIRNAFLDAGGKKIAKGIPIILRVVVFRPRPVSLPKKREYAVSRPDLDNYVKTVMDGLNKYAWEDDSQIVSLSAQKLFGDPPRIEVEINTIEERI